MAIVIIYFCIEQPIRILVDEMKEEEDLKSTNRRNLATMPTNTLFTQEPYLVASSTPTKTTEPVGIFIFVQDPSEAHIHYDAEFKKYATFEYILRDSSGKVVSTGDFEECDTTLFKDFAKLPELSAVELDDIFCPKIDIASEILKGKIEIQIKKCDSTKSTECKAAYSHFKWFGSKTFSTGVAFNAPYVEDNKLVMVPEV